MKKKVLIIANLFHASPRIPAISKYLSDFDWEPTIVTTPIKDDFKNLLAFPDDFKNKVRIIEVGYKGDIFWFWRKIFKIFGFKSNKSILNQTKEKINIFSKKSFLDYILKFYLTLFAYPDSEKNWKKPALKVLDDLFKKEKFDAVISSSSPVTTHIIASKLKEKYNFLWLADFRDLWTQNHNYSYFWFRKFFEKRLELKTLKLADTLISISDPLTEKLKSFHKNKKTYTITNGFDPEKVNYPSNLVTKKFTITYTGQIYSNKQNPLIFLIALKSLISEKIINPIDIEVRFYGPEMVWLDKKIKDYELSDIVKQYGKVKREISLEKQRESQILLFLKWEDEKQTGVYTGKIFEYLSSRRPILSTGGVKDVVSNLLKETNAGIDALDISQIKESFKNLYLEYKEKGEIEYKGDLEKINKYNYKKIAERFSILFEDGGMDNV
ncbi:MAG: glycosyltransferase [Candidatus Nealsonbacteria bacterium]